MSNTELLAKNVVFFQILVRKRWFYFSGFYWTSDAHNLKPQLETSQLLLQDTKRYFLNRLCVSKEDDFASSNSTFVVESGKPFSKDFKPASPGWRALSFPKRTFFQGSVSWNIVYTTKLISQFDAIVWVSVKTVCYEIFLLRVMLRKTVFWNFHSVFKFLRKRSLSEKEYFRKVTTIDGVFLLGDRKVKNCFVAENSCQQ